MSVDNNAILFVGLELNDHREALLMEKFGYESDNNEEFFAEDEDLVVRDTSGYSSGESLVGFEIADSGSYGTLVIEDCENLIVDAKKRFKKIFGEEAQVYLYNYQW